MNNSTESLKRMPLQRFEYMRKLIPLLKNQSEDCLYLNIFTPSVGGLQSSLPSGIINLFTMFDVLVLSHDL
jgi:carboxylesterase type B